MFNLSSLSINTHGGEAVNLLTAIHESLRVTNDFLKILSSP